MAHERPHQAPKSNGSNGSNGASSTTPLELHLAVNDPQVVAFLERLPDGRARHDRAIDATRIGFLALQHADGQIDADKVRRDGDHLVDAVRTQLDEHARRVSELRRRVARAGDTFEATGSRVGRIKNNKKGDGVIELGPEHTAASSRIVVEAKHREGFSVPRAREELRQARKNRDAEVGMFVFSAKTAPAGLEPLTRYGDDIVLVWDGDDPATDVVLDAGLAVSRAISIARAPVTDEDEPDLEAMDRAVHNIGKRVYNLAKVRKMAVSVSKNGSEIVKRVDLDRKALEEDLACPTPHTASAVRCFRLAGG